MNRSLVGRLLAAALAASALLAATSTPVIARKQAPDEEGSTRTLYLSLIRQARVDGRPRAAIAYLDDFDRQHPGDPEAQILRVNCLLDLGQTEAAQAALSRVPANSRNGDALAVRGHVLAAQGRWQEAAGQYAVALAASPADPMIGNALGYAQLRGGQTAQAIETLRGALDLAPKDDVIRNNLGLALTVSGRPAEAAKLLSRMPDNRERKRLSAQFATEAARLIGLSAVGDAGKGVAR